MNESPTNYDNIRAFVHQYEETLREIERTLAEAEDAQWQASPHPTSRDDAAVKSVGSVSDPTLSIVMDGRRLALRKYVQEAHRAVLNAYKTLSAANHHLNRALEAWNGDFDGKA